MRALRPATLGVAVGLALVGGAISPAVAVGRAPEHRAEKRPGAERALPKLFDNVGISDDADPAAADLDGYGHSLSAQDLSAADWTPGRTLTLQRTELTWPDVPPGQPDNVISDGQRVALPGRGDALTFLVMSTRGDTRAATGEVVYVDGTRGPYALSVPDWVTGASATKALTLPHVNSRDGQLGRRVKVYVRSVALDPRKTVKSVVLPDSPGGNGPDLHVFALSTRTGSTGLTGSWATTTSGYSSAGPWNDQTLRLVVHSSAGGPLARIRFDNTFADEPVTIGRATVAVQAKGAAPRGAPVPLTFDGKEGVTIAAGSQHYSDPAPGFIVPSGTNLLVSLHLPEPVSAAPAHHAAIQTSYLSASGTGDHTADTTTDAFTGTFGNWPFLAAIDVRGGPGSVVALGDSITDGVGSSRGANRRWPDQLARRLRAQSDVPRYGVLNAGISGNQVVRDRYSGDGVSNRTSGVSAVHRLERDVLSQTSTRTVILFEGVNDTRADTTAQAVIDGLRDIAERSRDHAVRILAATISPCAGWYDCTSVSEEKRQAVNTFIRENGDGKVFDGVLDFDKVLRDPADPSRILPAYDTGDHLHPNDAGLAAVADSIDLSLLKVPGKHPVPAP